MSWYQPPICQGNSRKVRTRRAASRNRALAIITGASWTAPEINKTNFAVSPDLCFGNEETALVFKRL
jgi:hypothetical protein